MIVQRNYRLVVLLLLLLVVASTAYAVPEHASKKNFGPGWDCRCPTADCQPGDTTKPDGEQDEEEAKFIHYLL